MFNRKSIEFVCVSGTPYERVQYLESLGVKVWPGPALVDKDAGTVTVEIQVPATQHRYAAGLLAGLGNGTAVLSPFPVTPIHPRTRWGVTRRAHGLAATILRVVAALVGVEAKLPPIAPKPARTAPKPQRVANTKPAAPAPKRKPAKRKSTRKPSAARRLWGSLSSE